jgi:hypothetical protein
VAAVSGFFVACTVVSLLQYLRHRDRRLLALLALFALRAAARFLGERSAFGVAFDLLSGAAGLVLLCWLSPRPPHVPSH